jgi:hypothetical protein
MKIKMMLLVLVLLSNFSFSQKTDYSIIAIPDSLKENANAVIRLSQLVITITSQKTMTLKSVQITTVLNELGLRNLDLVAHYDKNYKINSHPLKNTQQYDC